MTLRYQASCVLDKPRARRQQAALVWNAQRQRLDPIDFPPSRARFRMRLPLLLVGAVLSVRWILVVPRRHPGSPLRARHSCQICESTPAARTRSGSADRHAPRVGWHNQDNAVKERAHLWAARDRARSAAAPRSTASHIFRIDPKLSQNLSLWPVGPSPTT